MSKLPEGFNPEQKEEEKKSPIFIIYRDNDLFQKQIPEMVKILSAMGRQVEVQSFPREATKEEIEEWYKENLKRLAGMEIISDQTAGIPYISSEFRESIQEKGIESIANLDDLISKATKRAIWGEETEEVFKNPDWELPLEQRHIIADQKSKKFYTKITKYILGNQENIPNKIYIFSDCILDHIDQESYTGIRDEERDGNKELFQKKFKELIKTYPEQMKELLIEGGIDAEKIIIKLGEINRKEFQEIDQEGNWVIIDRHSKMFGDYNNDDHYETKLSAAKCLNLPESSFYNSAREAGLIDIPEKEFNQNLAKVLDKKLGGQI